MAYPPHLPIADFLAEARLKLNWLTNERSRLLSSSDNKGSELAIRNARRELLSLIKKVSTKVKQR